MSLLRNTALAWLAAFLTWVVGDCETTLRATDAGLSEGNPIVRPFVKRGRWWLYAFKAATFGFLYYALGDDAESGWSIAIFGAVIALNNVLQLVLSRAFDQTADGPHAPEGGA